MKNYNVKDIGQCTGEKQLAALLLADADFMYLYTYSFNHISIFELGEVSSLSNIYMSLEHFIHKICQNNSFFPEAVRSEPGSRTEATEIELRASANYIEFILYIALVVDVYIESAYSNKKIADNLLKKVNTNINLHDDHILTPTRVEFFLTSNVSPGYKLRFILFFPSFSVQKFGAYKNLDEILTGRHFDLSIMFVCSGFPNPLKNEITCLILSGLSVLPQCVEELIARWLAHNNIK